MDQALDEANNVKNLSDFEIYASKIEWLLSFAMSVAKVSVEVYKSKNRLYSLIKFSN